MASAIYPSLRADLMGAINLPSDNIKVMLVRGYSYNAAHTNKSQITGEISGTGYTAGGKALTSKTTTNGVFDAADAEWADSTITADGAVLYKDTGTPATSPLLSYFDLGGDKASSGAMFKVAWNAAGIFTVSIV